MLKKLKNQNTFYLDWKKVKVYWKLGMPMQYIGSN